jgi:hypothetical protein
MAQYINVDGVWKEFTPSIKVADTWKPVNAGYINVDGVWKEFYALSVPEEPVIETFVTLGFNSEVSAASTDAITWTQGTLPVTASWREVAHGNGTFVTAGYSSTIAATSTDGITWTQQTLPYGSWRQITHGNGIFVTVAGNTTTALVSTDGITWTQQVLPTSVNWIPVGSG